MLALEVATPSVPARAKRKHDDARFTHDRFHVGPFQMHRQRDHFEICTRYIEILEVCFMLVSHFGFRGCTHWRFHPWPSARTTSCDSPMCCCNLAVQVQCQHAHILRFEFCTRYNDILRFGFICSPILVSKLQDCQCQYGSDANMATCDPPMVGSNLAVQTCDVSNAISAFHIYISYC